MLSRIQDFVRELPFPPLLAALYFFPPLLLWIGVLPFEYHYHILMGVVVGVFAYSVKQGYSQREMGIRTDNLWEAMKWHLGVIAFMTVGAFCLHFGGLLPGHAPPEWKLFFVFYIFISGPVQEFLFRSLPFFYLRDFSKWQQITITALVFAWLHIFFHDPYIMVFTLMMGFVWGYLYYKVPNFWATSLSHSVLGAIGLWLGAI